ncbi:hypothetical protein [Pseudobutyrivibrio sp.]|uniref:hypothetical protein n=1 Tax=Pseudobutyrivibrio sp. TaxID=2014367 RepID=UPI0025E4CB4B|nr:hypothetical protein [Pseudobutyrivibrio sp.]
MGQKFKAMFEVRRDSILLSYGIFLIAMVFGIIICFFAMDGKDFDSIRYAAVIGGASIYFSISVFFRIVYYSMESQRAVLFGMTRRDTFIFEKIIDFIEIAGLAIICAVLLPGGKYLLVFKLAVLTFAFFSWLEAICGNLVIRYGKIGYWVCYVGIFVVFLGFPKLLQFVPAVRNVLGKIAEGMVFSNQSQGAYWGAMAGVIALALIVHWILFRKISVSSLAE